MSKRLPPTKDIYLLDTSGLTLRGRWRRIATDPHICSALHWRQIVPCSGKLTHRHANGSLYARLDSTWAAGNDGQEYPECAPVRPFAIPHNGLLPSLWHLGSNPAVVGGTGEHLYQG